jgi:hypothetical protein
MPASIYRQGRDQLVWEDDRCTLSFESSGPGQPLSADDLVAMEGDIDLSDLTAVLAQAAADINEWQAKGR